MYTITVSKDIREPSGILPYAKLSGRCTIYPKGLRGSFLLRFDKGPNVKAIITHIPGGLGPKAGP